MNEIVNVRRFARDFVYSNYTYILSGCDSAQIEQQQQRKKNTKNLPRK